MKTGSHSEHMSSNAIAEDLRALIGRVWPTKIINRRINRAADEIDRLQSLNAALNDQNVRAAQRLTDLQSERDEARRLLHYVLEDEPNLLPRASSSCRAYIRAHLKVQP